MAETKSKNVNGKNGNSGSTTAFKSVESDLSRIEYKTSVAVQKRLQELEKLHEPIWDEERRLRGLEAELIMQEKIAVGSCFRIVNKPHCGGVINTKRLLADKSRSYGQVIQRIDADNILIEYVEVAPHHTSIRQVFDRIADWDWISSSVQRIEVSNSEYQAVKRDALKILSFNNGTN